MQDELAIVAAEMIPPGEAVFRENAVVLGEDVRAAGRMALLLMSACFISIALLAHVRSGDHDMWVRALFVYGFGCFGIGAAIRAGYRRKVAIDLAHDRVVVVSGFLVPFIRRIFPLAGYNQLQVKSSIEPGCRHRPDKLHERFYLVGRNRLLIAWRCYMRSDKRRERMLRVFEVKLRDALNGHMNVAASGPTRRGAGGSNAGPREPATSTAGPSRQRL